MDRIIKRIFYSSILELHLLSFKNNYIGYKTFDDTKVITSKIICMYKQHVATLAAAAL